MVCMCAMVVSCNRKKGDATLILPQTALPCSVSCETPLTDSVYAVPENFESVLYRLLKQPRGKKMELRSPYPEAWQLETTLESPFPGVDLWIVSNQGEAVYKLLLTVSVPRSEKESAEVIDGLLLAYSVANEQSNRIESEAWNAEIDDDMQIRVHKRYEVLYSMSDTTHSQRDNRLNEVTDLFHVDYNGYITYEEPQFTEQYRAIVQFMDTAESGLQLDDEWMENAMLMQSNLEPLNIYFLEVFQHFDEVLLTNYHGEAVDKVDIASFLKTYGRGYVLLEKGKKPRYVRYGAAVNCLKKAFALWEIDAEIIGDSDTDNEADEEWTE